VVVVVAGEDHHLAPGAESLADAVKDARSRGERVPDRAFAQLEHIAEEHEPIDALELGEQGVAGRGIAETVTPAPRPQVEVGDDERPHAGY
jgi:hypothetical protein